MANCFCLSVPENFGAIGDGVSDDSNALESLFNSWQVSGVTESFAIAFMPGKIYRFTRPLTVDGGTTGVNFTCILEGNGALLQYDPATPDEEYALRVGSFTDNRKAFWSAFSNFSILTNGALGTALALDYGDFCHFNNIRVAANNAKSAIRIRNNNSLTFINVNTSASDVGVQIVPKRHPGQEVRPVVNVFHWTGGRVQQHDIGIEYSGTTFRIQQVDFSLINDWAMKIDHASNGHIECYIESIGKRKPDDVAIRNHQGGCLLLQNCANS